MEKFTQEQLQLSSMVVRIGVVLHKFFCCGGGPPFLLLSLLIERLQNLTSSYCQDEEYRFAGFQQPFWSVESSKESQVPDGSSEPPSA